MLFITILHNYAAVFWYNCISNKVHLHGSCYLHNAAIQAIVILVNSDSVSLIFHFNPEFIFTADLHLRLKDAL